MKNLLVFLIAGIVSLTFTSNVDAQNKRFKGRKDLQVHKKKIDKGMKKDRRNFQRRWHHQPRQTQQRHRQPRWNQRPQWQSRRPQQHRRFQWRDQRTFRHPRMMQRQPRHFGHRCYEPQRRFGHRWKSRRMGHSRFCMHHRRGMQHRFGRR